MLDIRQGQMFSLNFVGSRILELLKSGSSETEIVKTLNRDFNADSEMVRKDVKEFLDALSTHKLIESNDTNGRSEAEGPLADSHGA